MAAARQWKTKRPMTLFYMDKPPVAHRAAPVNSRLIQDRQDATVQALEEAVIRNTRAGKGHQ